MCERLSLECIYSLYVQRGSFSRRQFSLSKSTPCLSLSTLIGQDQSFHKLNRYIGTADSTTRQYLHISCYFGSTPYLPIRQVILADMIKRFIRTSPISPLILPDAIEAVDQGESRSSTRRANTCNETRSIFDREQERAKNISYFSLESIECKELGKTYRDSIRQTSRKG